MLSGSRKNNFRVCDEGKLTKFSSINPLASKNYSDATESKFFITEAMVGA